MTEFPTPYITDRTDALLSLLQPSLSDADIARIVAAIVDHVAAQPSGDDPEMHRPMGQGEAAAWLGVNRSTLSQWTNQDDDPAPGFRIGGKVLYTKLVEGIRDVTTAATCERTTSAWAGRRPVCDALPASTLWPVRTGGHRNRVTGRFARGTENAGMPRRL